MTDDLVKRLRNPIGAMRPTLTDGREAADRIEELEAKLAEAVGFLSYAIDMTGEPHCYHDHHGYCQAHNLEPRDDCWVKKSQALSAELTSSEAAYNEVKGGKDE